MGKYPSLGALDDDIEASGMVCSVVAGSFYTYLFFPPNISRSALGAGALCVCIARIRLEIHGNNK
jgi:hypothetical protein